MVAESTSSVRGVRDANGRMFRKDPVRWLFRLRDALSSVGGYDFTVNVRRYDSIFPPHLGENRHVLFLEIRKPGELRYGTIPFYSSLDISRMRSFLNGHEVVFLGDLEFRIPPFSSFDELMMKLELGGNRVG